MRSPTVHPGRWAFITSTLILACSLPAQGADRCEVRSGPRPASVVELYTSEGCDSCPPADRWMSGLGQRNDVVALGFHVDYWNRLGWTDRFSSPAYTQRQHEQLRSSGARFSYTPQVLINGRDWRGWSNDPLPAGAPASVVDVRLVRDGDHVRASVTPSKGAPQQLAAYWAGVEDGHDSTVKAGENAGVTLHHDQVVRSYQPVSAWRSTDGVRELAFDSLMLGESGRPRRVVLVVTDAGSGLPVQALALNACKTP